MIAFRKFAAALSNCPFFASTTPRKLKRRGSDGETCIAWLLVLALVRSPDLICC